MLTIKKYNGDIDWNVGALFGHSTRLLNLLTNTKKMNLDTKIRYVFGCFTCKLNSGRQVWGGNPTIEFVSNAIDQYNDLGVSVRFTFSNNYIEEKDLKDPLVNDVLSYIDNKNKNISTLENGVILVSELLTQYIRENYKNVPLISSLYKTGIETGFVTDTPDYYNSLLDRYDVVVVDTNKIKDNNVKFLESLKDKSRVEFIANNHCMKHCPNVRKHDMAVARMQLAICKDDLEEAKKIHKEIDTYLSHCEAAYERDKDNSTLILTDDEINMCIDMGYKHFKIQGREEPAETLFGDIASYIFSDSEIDDKNHLDVARRRTKHSDS